jgi:hypothetical protein
MRKILSWYKFHLLRSFEFDRAWPWQKVYWKELGNDEREYEKANGLQLPWHKTFWLSPRMLRFYSILMVMVGFHVFIIGLMLLAVAIELMARAIAG